MPNHRLTPPAGDGGVPGLRRHPGLQGGRPLQGRRQDAGQVPHWHPPQGREARLLSLIQPYF